MKVAIHEANYGKYGYERFQAYREILKYNNIDYLDVRIDQEDFWREIQKCDLFLYRWSQTDNHHQIAEAIIPVIENYYNIKCFPNQNTCWHFDDKVKQYYLLKSKNAPIINCNIFYCKNTALSWAKNANYPIVFKLKGGAGSLNVSMIKNYSQASKIIKQMFGRGIYPGKIPVGNIKFHNLKTYIKKTFGPIYYVIKTGEREIWQKHKGYVLFQDFLRDNECDTRVTIIGKRAFAFRRLNRKNDFRSSGSGLIDYSTEAINLEMLKIAFKTSKDFGFQSMAYDFLYNGENPEFCEISYTYDDRAIYNCPGYWDDELKFHSGHFWPQYFHIMDALNNTTIQQPDLGKLYQGS